MLDENLKSAAFRRPIGKNKQVYPGSMSTGNRLGLINHPHPFPLENENGDGKEGLTCLIK